MKLKIQILLPFIILLYNTATAQVKTDSSKSRQFSAGLNIFRPFSNNESSYELPYGFVKYRINNHAFKFSFSSGSFSHNYFFGTNDLSDLIFTSDSVMIYRYQSDFLTGGSAAVGIEKYQSLLSKEKVEFYIGVGLRYGSSTAKSGYNYVTYTKDSTGNYLLNDSLSQIYHPGIEGNYKTKQFGIVPYGGFLIMPDKIFSIAFEAAAPVIYESKIPDSETLKINSGVSFNMLFSIHLILNFNLNFTDEK